MRKTANIYIRTILTCLLGSLLLVLPSRAQRAFDFSVTANWLEQSNIHGLGGALHVALADYLIELVPSGVLYRTPDDSSDTWSAGLDGRINLIPVSIVRPYVGVGFLRMKQSGRSDTILNLSAGINIRLGKGRKIPFMEAAYRPDSSFDPWRYRAGIRLNLRGS